MLIALARDVGIVTSLAFPFRLTINSLDLITPAGTPLQTFGVPVDSVHVVEAFLTDIPTCEFTIEDPGNAIVVIGGEDVQLWDTTRDEPLFAGIVDSFDEVTFAGQQGREWAVRCVGYSKPVLEATQVTAEAMAGYQLAGLTAVDFIQHLAATYAPTIRAFASPTAVQGSQAQPIGTLAPVGSRFFATPTPAAFTGSLAAAIRSAGDASLGNNGHAAVGAFVDFYHGLRVFLAEWDPTGGSGAYIAPQGAAPFNISDVPGGGVVAPEDLTYSIDLSQLVNAVYLSVNGGASSWYKDGTSIALYGERQAVASYTGGGIDPTLYAQMYLAQHAPLLRGSFTVSGPGREGLHAGQSISITNAALGLAAAQAIIGSVETTFDGGTNRTWRVQFTGSLGTTGRYGGALAPSVARLIRSLVQ